MKNKEFIDGGDLFVARVRVVLDNDPITGDRRTMPHTRATRE